MLLLYKATVCILLGFCSYLIKFLRAFFSVVTLIIFFTDEISSFLQILQQVERK